MACACSIFLIDHAWTCRVEHARQQLQQVPGLLHRMANLMGVEFHGELPSPEAVDQVLEEMWKFNQTYQLSHGVSRRPVPRGGGGQTRPQAFTAPCSQGYRGVARRAPAQPGGLYPAHEQTQPLPWPVESLCSCGFIVGLLLFASDQPATQVSVQPLNSQGRTLRPLDLGSVTRPPLSWCLLVLSPS